MADQQPVTAPGAPERSQIRAATVLFAEDVARLSDFYRAVVGLEVTESVGYHVVLESPTYQLAVVEMAAHLAAAVRAADSPWGRRENAVKLAFVVASIREARPVVAAHGGDLLPADREWQFQSWRVCDGHDCEGNAIQLREPADPSP